MITFLKAMNAGFIIGIGGTCFLSVPDKVIGSAMFAVGLLTICVTEQLLFTGRCSYCFDIKYLLTILAGNIIGATLIGLLIGTIKPDLATRAAEMCQTKLGEGIRIIPLGILCNILIYFAVEGYKKGQTILLIMCVMAFILCGFEHCVANMFYFAVAREYSAFAIGYLICNICYNWLGGILVFGGKKYAMYH